MTEKAWKKRVDMRIKLQIVQMCCQKVAKYIFIHDIGDGNLWKSSAGPEVSFLDSGGQGS